MTNYCYYHSPIRSTLRAPHFQESWFPAIHLKTFPAAYGCAAIRPATLCTTYSS